MDSDLEEISTKVEVRKIGMKHTSKDGHVLSLSINPEDTPHELMQDYLGQRYLMVLVRLDNQEQPVPSRDKGEGLAAVKLAGMLCGDLKFQSWLCIIGLADEATEESAINAVRTYCNVKSRSEFKTNKEARDRFLGLKDEFASGMRR